MLRLGLVRALVGVHFCVLVVWCGVAWRGVIWVWGTVAGDGAICCALLCFFELLKLMYYKFRRSALLNNSTS